MVPQIMQTIRAASHHITAETPNQLMLGRETKLAKELLILQTKSLNMVVDKNALQLQRNLQVVGDRLCNLQQLLLRANHSQEPFRLQIGDKAWLKYFYKSQGRGSYLLLKYVRPYTVKTVLPYQTYQLEWNGKFSVHHKGQIGCHIKIVPSSQSITNFTEQLAS